MRMSSIVTLLVNIIFFLPSYATQSSAQALQESLHKADYIFCVDGGGSKTSLRVINSKSEILDIEHKGTITSELIAGPTNINTVGFEETKNALAQLLIGLKIGAEKHELSEIKDSSAIVCGLAGLTSNIEKAPLLQELFISLGFQSSRIALFSDIDLAKQIIGEQGAILISGTGSICFSKTPRGEKRIGGYGYALGDEGSGFYIGKLALQAAFEEEFEDEPFALTKSLCELFNLDASSQVIKFFYSNALKPSDIAKGCPLVFEAAYEQNDERCLKIIGKGAAALAHLVKRAVKDTTFPNFPVYLIGGVFKNANANDFIEKINTKVNYPYGLQFINISQNNVAVLAIQANRQ